MNPVLQQDRIEHMYELYKSSGQVMYEVQRKIYFNLSLLIPANATVLDAGCGTGQGTAILHSPQRSVSGADIVYDNIDFANQLYPRTTFFQWNMCGEKLARPYDYVVCVEAIEHTSSVVKAIDNLWAATTRKLWISTPNRSVENPENEYHTREYSSVEMSELIAEAIGVAPVIKHWQTLEVLDVDTLVDPVIYEVSV